MILSIAQMMADADVDLTISIAEKWEYKHCTTSIYSLIESGPKRSPRRCSQGPFGSSVILNGSCSLVLVTAYVTLLLKCLTLCQYWETRCTPWHTTLSSPTPDVPYVLVGQRLIGVMKVSEWCFLLVWCHLISEFFECVLVWCQNLLVLLSDVPVHNGLW